MPGSKRIGNPTGLTGKSAYEIAFDHGFEGTEAEWLLSLVGGSEAFNAWLEAHPEYTTTVLDNSITRAKLTNELLEELLATDASLSEEGIAADAKAVGDELANTVKIIEQTLSAAQKAQVLSNLGLGDLDDYVVERGTSNNWHYQKWASGRITATREVWWSTITFSESQRYPGVGAFAYMEGISLPTGLIERPLLFGNCIYGAALMLCTFHNITLSTFQMRIIRLFSTSNMDEVHYSLSLDGKWK